MFNYGISINCGSRKIEGEFCLLEVSDIAIKLVNPELDLVGYSNHIPHFALSQNSFLDLSGETTDYCLITANRILISLYKSYQFIIENKGKVRKSILEFREFILEYAEEFSYIHKIKTYEKKEIKKKLEMNEEIFNKNKYFLDQIKFELIDGPDCIYNKVMKTLDRNTELIFGYKIPPSVRTYIYSQGIRSY
jgi:hypothetical protein